LLLLLPTDPSVVLYININILILGQRLQGCPEKEGKHEEVKWALNLPLKKMILFIYFIYLPPVRYWLVHAETGVSFILYLVVPTYFFYTYFSFQAEELVLNGFPVKIVELNELLTTPLLNNKDMTEIHQDLNVPVPDPILLNNDISVGSPVKRPRIEANKTPLNVDGTKVMVLPNGLYPLQLHLYFINLKKRDHL